MRFGCGCGPGSSLQRTQMGSWSSSRRKPQPSRPHHEQAGNAEWTMAMSVMSALLHRPSSPWGDSEVTGSRARGSGGGRDRDAALFEQALELVERDASVAAWRGHAAQDSLVAVAADGATRERQALAREKRCGLLWRHYALLQTEGTRPSWQRCPICPTIAQHAFSSRSTRGIIRESSLDTYSQRMRSLAKQRLCEQSGACGIDLAGSCPQSQPQRRMRSVPSPWAATRSGYVGTLGDAERSRPHRAHACSG